MSRPTEEDWKALKKLGRYLVKRPRGGTLWRWQGKPELVTTWVDNDFAGCRRTGKSTSGGVLKLGSHLLKTWSITQGIIGLQVKPSIMD